MTLECVVVIPVYNEAACITDVLQDWHETLSNIFESQFHIIVINDGSTDNSAALIKAASQTHPHITLINQDNEGHGAAIRRGYEHALTMHTDFIFQTDSDNQIPAADFAKIWKKRRASRCVLGCRSDREDAFLRRIASKIISLLIRVLYGLDIPDSNVPFRLYEQRFLMDLLKSIPKSCFAPNIFLSIEAKISGENLWHIPVNHNARQTGTASLQTGGLLSAGIKTLRELCAHKSQTNG